MTRSSCMSAHPTTDRPGLLRLVHPLKEPIAMPCLTTSTASGLVQWYIGLHTTTAAPRLEGDVAESVRVKIHEYCAYKRWPDPDVWPLDRMLWLKLSFPLSLTPTQVVCNVKDYTRSALWARFDTANRRPRIWRQDFVVWPT